MFLTKQALSACPWAHVIIFLPTFQTTNQLMEKYMITIQNPAKYIDWNIIHNGLIATDHFTSKFIRTVCQQCFLWWRVLSGSHDNALVSSLCTPSLVHTVTRARDTPTVANEWTSQSNAQPDTHMSLVGSVPTRIRLTCFTTCMVAMVAAVAHPL